MKPCKKSGHNRVKKCPLQQEQIPADAVFCGDLLETLFVPITPDF
jgi:hypothetical protein